MTLSRWIAALLLVSLAVKETRYLMCVRLFTYKAVHED